MFYSWGGLKREERPCKRILSHPKSPAGSSGPQWGKISQRPWVLPRAFFIGGSEVRVGMDRIHLN